MISLDEAKRYCEEYTLNPSSEMRPLDAAVGYALAEETGPFAKHHTLRPIDLTILAEAHIDELSVYQRPKVQVLLEPELSTLSHSLQAAMAQKQFESSRAELSLDNIQKASEDHEVLILICQDEKAMIEKLNSLELRHIFTEVNQSPGSQFSLSTMHNGTVIFTLASQNLATAQILYRFYIHPYLQVSAGSRKLIQSRARLADMFSYAKKTSRFLPVLRKQGQTLNIQVKPTEADDFVQSDGFIILPEEQDDFPFGFESSYFSWSPIH